MQFKQLVVATLALAGLVAATPVAEPKGPHILCLFACIPDNNTNVLMPPVQPITDASGAVVPLCQCPAGSKLYLLFDLSKNMC